MSADTVQHEILHRPDFGFLQVRLTPGQSIHAEPGAMASMDSGVKMKTSLKGGLWKSIKRGIGGESLVMNTYTAGDRPAEVTFAPGPLGDLVHHRLDGSGALLLQRGGYVASTPGVTVDSQWQGFRGFFSGEGLFLLHCSGQGDLFFNTFGAVLEVDVKDEWYVDSSYVVAFEDTLDYRVTALPGMRPSGGVKGFFKGVKNFFLGGEYLVCQFTGQGRLWVQTRSVGAFTNWVQPYRPVESSSSD